MCMYGLTGGARNAVGSRRVRTTDLVGLCVVNTMCRSCSDLSSGCDGSRLSGTLGSVVAIDSGSTTGALIGCLNNKSSTTKVTHIGGFYRSRKCADASVKHLLLTSGSGKSGCASTGSYKGFLGAVCRVSGNATASGGSALTKTRCVCHLLGVRAEGGGVPTRVPSRMGITGGANRLSGMRGSTNVVCSATGKVSLMIYFVSRSLGSASTTRGAVTRSDHTVCKCCGRWRGGELAKSSGGEVVHRQGTSSFFRFFSSPSS